MDRISRKELKPAVARIANGAATSEAISNDGASVAGVIFPAAMTAATFSIHVCDTFGGTYRQLYDDQGVAVSGLPVAANTAIALPIAIMAFPFFKIVTNVNEGANRDLTIVRKG